jgi:putative lysine/arginine/ornithine/histidine/octopine transport system substrate-binding protein
MNGNFWRGAILAPAMVSIVFVMSAVSAKAQDIRIATEGYYAPFNYFDDTGNLAGFDVDIFKALWEPMGASCEIVQKDWNGLISGLNDNEYDAIIASMPITDDREKTVDFTLPYYSNVLTFVGQKNHQLSAGPEDLAGKSVGDLRNTVSSDYLTETCVDVVSVGLFGTQDASLAALVAGEIDLVLGDNLPIYASLQTDAGQEHAFVREFIDIKDRISIGIRKTDRELLDCFNETLIEIIENGTYQAINARYFPFSIYF